MLSFGEYCLVITHLPSGIMEEVLLIVPKEIKGIGFLSGKMGSVISMNVRVQDVDTLRDGLGRMSSSKCLMRFITMEKVGKVAADNSHKWVYREDIKENDPSCVSSLNASIEPQPKAWEIQFNSGIQTIALISVREGIIQLGSFDKILEDLSLVINVQRKFSYLQSIPGVFPIQRPYLPIHLPCIIKPNTQMSESQETALLADEKQQLSGAKRLFNEFPHDFPIKSINFGWNSPQNGIAGASIWPIPPLLPSMSYSLGALLSKLPSVAPSININESPATALINNGNSINTMCQKVKADNGADRKVESSCQLDDQEQKPVFINTHLDGKEEVELGLEALREGGSALNIN
ncbi:uncharacterized protein LOC123203169 isoform X2 [Mangifera indica]|uniref:uncharacterized protein LOC123203169 isoform X2 n=1 Tax=Mangifera indica TaxID=29780 RepID=UPI001CFA1B70|nr:uncharacterized protein LOC123203169 isoform X2 [Mangifera indica]